MQNAGFLVPSSTEVTLIVSGWALQIRDPMDNAVVRSLYDTWIRDAPGSAAARALFHTQFHAVLKSDLNPLAIKW